jgi:hypothetical protein
MLCIAGDKIPFRMHMKRAIGSKNARPALAAEKGVALQKRRDCQSKVQRPILSSPRLSDTASAKDLEIILAAVVGLFLDIDNSSLLQCRCHCSMLPQRW